MRFNGALELLVFHVYRDGQVVLTTYKVRMWGITYGEFKRRSHAELFMEALEVKMSRPRESTDDSLQHRGLAGR